MRGTSESSQAVIEISRTRQRANALRSIAVYVDRRKAGTVRLGSVVRFEVEPGTHEIYTRIDWQRSNSFIVHAAAGDVVRFECGSYLSGWKAIFAFPAALLPRCWIYLRPVSHR